MCKLSYLCNCLTLIQILKLLEIFLYCHRCYMQVVRSLVCYILHSILEPGISCMMKIN